jgi:hypothetical protein
MIHLSRRRALGAFVGSIFGWLGIKATAAEEKPPQPMGPVKADEHMTTFVYDSCNRLCRVTGRPSFSYTWGDKDNSTAWDGHDN